MNWNLLIEHLQLAIMLGAISSGIVETLKEWFFKDLQGRKLTFVSLGLTAIISFTIGYFYVDTTINALIASTLWGVIGAQSVYAIVKQLQNKEGEK